MPVEVLCIEIFPSSLAWNDPDDVVSEIHLRELSYIQQFGQRPEASRVLGGVVSSSRWRPSPYLTGGQRICRGLTEPNGSRAGPSRGASFILRRDSGPCSLLLCTLRSTAKSSLASLPWRRNKNSEPVEYENWSVLYTDSEKVERQACRAYADMTAGLTT